MNREEFYRLFAKEYDTTLIKSRKYCYEVFTLLSKCIREKERVYIKGLGTFKKKKTAAHRIGNLTGEGSMVIPPSEKIVFDLYSGEFDEI